jgi:hypothetical protein
MKRDPSLHITKSNLVKVLKAALIPFEDADIERIFEKAAVYQIKNRYLLKAVGKDGKAVKKVMDNTSGNVQMFNRLLNQLRLKANHRFTSVIGKGTSEYVILMEIASLAEAFKLKYKIDATDEAYTYYIESGLELMGNKYGLSKFKYYNTSICETFECAVEISEDKTKDDTKAFQECWKVIMLERVGECPTIKKVSDYVHLVRGKNAAKAKKASFANWIDAQFEGLAFLSAIPELNQMYGDNALKRYDKYMQAATSAKKKDATALGDEADIKKIKGADLDYFDLIKNAKKK